MRKNREPARSKPAAGKKPAAKAPSLVVAADSVTFNLEVSQHGLEPILGAAYLLTDRCHVVVDGDRAKLLSVTLRGKAPLQGRELAELFERELETQKLRWAVAKANQPVREYIAEQSVLVANGGDAPAAPPADELTEEQRKEIDALIAEVEQEIKTLKDKKAAADPKNISATWEEKHKA